MKKRLMFLAGLVTAVVSVSLAAGSAFAGSVVYDATPTPLPGNVASVGFEATSTSEFGDYVHLSSTSIDRRLSTVTVTMSDWALYSDYASDARYAGNSATWSHPITVNVYSNHLGANGAPDTLLATTTQPITIPWRPAVYGFNGIAFNATFDLSSPAVTLPNDVIVGVAYNTADYGKAPIGVAGPYNSLNVGVPTGQTASVGTDDNPDNVFWNTSFAGFYADGGLAGVGIFRQATNWTPNGTAAIQITTAATCTPTGFVKDGMDLTAAQIGGGANGVDLDATGCNIGIYYNADHPGSVSNSNIHGANYYGVVVDGTNATVAGSTIHDIGESPLNGTQHGNAVLYTNGATGTASGDTVYHYQKNGITVSGNGTSVSVTGNTVTGEGPVNYIAQNGIQISFGGSATVTGNTVSGDWYTPATVTACGLLFYQASGVKQSKNNLFDNQTNLCNAGRGGGNSSAG